MRSLANFIDGRFVPPLTGEYLDSFNPATGLVHLKVPSSDARDVNDAVAAARRAFASWAATPDAERARLLLAIADGIDARKEELARAESEDQGKPVWLAASMDISRAAHNFRFFAGALLHCEDESTRMGDGISNSVTRKPVGIAALIAPWNLPLYLLSWKIAPAIAFGNCAICKPSEITSLTAFHLCEIMQKAGLPNGVVNMVFGDGPRVGQSLVGHPDVPLVSFTGGTATGRTIALQAAPLFKKLSLELGGKNPNIVFDDADLDKTLETTVRSSFLNQGEICLCGSRIYVQKKIYEAFLARFVLKVRELKVGDPSDPTTFIGPLASREHLEKVLSFIKLAREEKAEIQCGGEAVVFSGPLEKGYFMKPTVLTNVKQSSRIQQEEIFGPVVTVTPFDSDAEGIALANDIKYGLSASVWTRDLHRAHWAAEQLEVGTVWVNNWLTRDLRMPFGGVKASGLGREGQHGSREFFTEAKTICIKYGD